MFKREGVLLLAINLCIEKWSTIFVSFMSWNIPKLNEKISFAVAFDAAWRATSISVSSVLDNQEKKMFFYELQTGYMRPFRIRKKKKKKTQFLPLQQLYILLFVEGER